MVIVRLKALSSESFALFNPKREFQEFCHNLIKEVNGLSVHLKFLAMSIFARYAHLK